MYRAGSSRNHGSARAKLCSTDCMWRPVRFGPHFHMEHWKARIVQASAAHIKPDVRLVYGTAGFRTK